MSEDSLSCSTFRSSSNCSVQLEYEDGSESTSAAGQEFRSIVSSGTLDATVSENPTPPPAMPRPPLSPPALKLPQFPAMRHFPRLPSTTPRRHSPVPERVPSIRFVRSEHGGSPLQGADERTQRQESGLHLAPAAPSNESRFLAALAGKRGSSELLSPHSGRGQSFTAAAPPRVPQRAARELSSTSIHSSSPTAGRNSHSSFPVFTAREPIPPPTRSEMAQRAASTTYHYLLNLMRYTGDVISRIVVVDPHEEDDRTVPKLELQQIGFDDYHEPFCVQDRVPEVRVLSDEEYIEDAISSSTPSDYQTHMEVDLVAALRGYLQNPNEVFGHLVAAALSRRSKDNPVTGEELSEARSHPYLVSMFVNSGCLDANDERVQLDIQRSVDTLVNVLAIDGGVNSSVYEYLHCLCQMTFVRLTPTQYNRLRGDGFEFVQLLISYPHLQPAASDWRAVLSKYIGPKVFLAVMIFDALCKVFCTVSFALVISVWMIGYDAKFRNYGYYTLMVYGGGYAATLVVMIFALRTKVPGSYYEKKVLTFPSAHLNVAPVIPVFDIVCIYSYIRYMFDEQQNSAVLTDLVAASRLSSMTYAICMGFPQLITQAYLLDLGGFVPESLSRSYSLKLLKGAVCIIWIIPLLRFAFAAFYYPSVNAFGLVCFSTRRKDISPPRNAFPRLIFYEFLFVAELGVYFIISGSISIDECWPQALILVVLGGVTVFFVVLIYFFLWLSSFTMLHISYLVIPTVILQIALWVFVGLSFQECNHKYLNSNFIFGYLAWCFMYAIFILWGISEAVMFVKKLLGENKHADENSAPSNSAASPRE